MLSQFLRNLRVGLNVCGCNLSAMLSSVQTCGAVFWSVPFRNLSVPYLCGISWRNLSVTQSPLTVWFCENSPVLLERPFASAYS